LGTPRNKIVHLVGHVIKVIGEQGSRAEYRRSQGIADDCDTHTRALVDHSRELAAADLDLPDDAKVALDDLTQEYRWGDAAR
jgi:hypothetical protein